MFLNYRPAGDELFNSIMLQLNANQQSAPKMMKAYEKAEPLSKKESVILTVHLALSHNTGTIAKQNCISAVRTTDWTSSDLRLKAKLLMIKHFSSNLIINSYVYCIQRVCINIIRTSLIVACAKDFVTLNPALWL